MRPDIHADSNAIHARPSNILVASARLQPHDAPSKRAAENESAAARYCGDDRSQHHPRRGGIRLAESQLFTDYERELFTRVVAMAEKEGKTVELLVVPGVNRFDAMVQTASRLQSSRLVTGLSARMDSEELARQIGQAWERLPEPRHPFSLEIITPDRPSIFVNLGPHRPRLWPEDLDLLHKMWLELTDEYTGSKLITGTLLALLCDGCPSNSNRTTAPKSSGTFFRKSDIKRNHIPRQIGLFPKTGSGNSHPSTADPQD
jgi:hypothetical protein